jgi:hypothetical protein
MTLMRGDRVATIPLAGGRITAALSGGMTIGDRVVLIPNGRGGRSAVRIASPIAGEKVALLPLRDGSRVCIQTLGDQTPVPPLVGFRGNWWDSPEYIHLFWDYAPEHTGARIVCRTDRYPTSIDDGDLIYEGSARWVEDTIANPLLPRYYSAWGRRNQRYSDVALTEHYDAWPKVTLPYLINRGYYWFDYPLTFGPYIFDWDGESTVIISSLDSNYLGAVSLWGTGTVTGPGGSVTVAWDCRSWIYKRFNITPALVPGMNVIRLSMAETPNLPDYCGGGAGFNSDAWIVEE